VDVARWAGEYAGRLLHDAGAVSEIGGGMYQSGAFPRRLTRDGSASKKAGALQVLRTLAEQDAPRPDATRHDAPPSAARISRAQCAQLARWLIAGDDAFRCEIEARLASSASPVGVMVDVLAPVARELGRLWDRDECDLIDVQRACGALQRVMGRIAPEAPARMPLKQPSILLQVAPGERHTFGADVAEAIFRDIGWRVTRGEGRGLRADLSREWRDFVGFSLSCDRNVESLSQAVAEARAASRNPNLLVVVGGAIFARRPDIARKIGADFCVCAAKLPVKHQKALVNGSAMSHVFHTRG